MTNSDVTGMWATVPRLLAENRYLVLGTADGEGQPWVTPVFFAARDEFQLFWVSAPDSRHSRNLAGRATTAITIFDSHSPIGGAEALYLVATVAPVDPGDGRAAIELLNSRLPTNQHLTTDDIAPSGPLRIYRADVTEHFVLIRGGDKRFDNVTDSRLPVTPNRD